VKEPFVRPLNQNIAQSSLR